MYTYYTNLIKTLSIVYYENIIWCVGLPPGLNKYRPRKVADVIKWDFISKAWYSDTDANPRRRIDSYTKEGLDDVVREVSTIHITKYVLTMKYELTNYYSFQYCIYSQSISEMASFNRIMIDL
jgi:hypothetical protein